tara:strand:- start:556 stop:786 length:231 start_codon:yes stop_codon:yes gene_type:complete
MKNENHPNKKNMTDTNEMRLATMRRALADRPMLDSLRPEDRELLIDLYTKRIESGDSYAPLGPRVLLTPSERGEDR